MTFTVLCFAAAFPAALMLFIIVLTASFEPFVKLEIAPFTRTPTSSRINIPAIKDQAVNQKCFYVLWTPPCDTDLLRQFLCIKAEKGLSLGWLRTMTCNMPSCGCSLLREIPCLARSCQHFYHPCASGRGGTQGSHVQQAPWSPGSGWASAKGERRVRSCSLKKKNKRRRGAHQQALMRGRGGVCWTGPAQSLEGCQRV